MNSSSRQTQNLLIDGSILALSSVSICISAVMFGFIFYHLMKMKHSSQRVALMLTCNMYFALLVFSLLLAEQYAHVFIGHRYSFLRYNDGADCPIRAYLQLVSICTIFYSNALQAIYRLCRVVFYTRPALQSVRLYRLVIVGQWIFCFLIIVPTLLMNDFEYLPDDYHCQIGFTNYRSTLLNGIFAYLVPMNITGGCYVYTLKRIRRGHSHLLENMSQIQQISARRDLIVLFRICLLVSLLMIFFFPSLVLLVIYQRTGYLAWWSSQVQWLVFITSVTCVTVALAVISPHVYNLWSTVGRRQLQTTGAPVALIRFP